MIESNPRLDSFELGTAISQAVGVSFYVDEIMYISTRRLKLKLNIKIMSGISVSGTSMCVRVSVRVSVCRSDKWLVGPSSTSSTIASFLFDKAMQGAARAVTVQRQINRTRGVRRTLRLFRVTRPSPSLARCKH